MRLFKRIAVALVPGAFAATTMWKFGKTASEPWAGSHSGRGSYDASVKELFLNLPLEQKRKKYIVDSYVELSEIPPWSQYKLLRSASKKPENPEKPADERLNNKVSLYKGNITELEIDAIVNAANEPLAGGGGVDGAIHDAAGWSLLQSECRTLGGCPTGEAKVTGGYHLPAKYVIHTVGPQHDNSRQLRKCYERSLDEARRIGARTVAFPCISTGVYGFPNEKAARTALLAVREVLEVHAESFDRVIFCVYLDIDNRLYEKYLPVFFPRDRVVESSSKAAGNSMSSTESPVAGNLAVVRSQSELTSMHSEMSHLHESASSGPEVASKSQLHDSASGLNPDKPVDSSNSDDKTMLDSTPEGATHHEEQVASSATPKSDVVVEEKSTTNSGKGARPNSVCLTLLFLSTLLSISRLLPHFCAGNTCNVHLKLCFPSVDEADATARTLAEAEGAEAARAESEGAEAQRAEAKGAEAKGAEAERAEAKGAEAERAKAEAEAVASAGVAPGPEIPKKVVIEPDEMEIDANEASPVGSSNMISNKESRTEAQNFDADPSESEQCSPMILTTTV